ncbi:MAG TPA: glycoside hydrolase family 71/99-like protein [Isosphaeraceae bacterium]|jgi:hypothetical protein
MRIARIALIAGLAWSLGARAEDRRPLILVHTMTWFASKPVSGAWGWHWTMGRLDPERVDASGRRAIAAHNSPEIGPYDSSDPAVLEYHALLMKVAGIDGAIADWYGNEDFNDYATIHRNTAALFDALAKHGLKFAVCYEDRAIKAMAEKRGLTPAEAVEHGRTHLRYCEAHWFGRPGYAKWEGKPLLLVFGPDYLAPTQWEEVFAGLKSPPAFFTLHERKAPAIGSFAWPPMWRSKGGVLDPKDLDDYLDEFTKRPGAKMAGAWPGFHDFYQEAGLHPSYGRLDARDGETFRRTLGRALASGNSYIQIATWNDFGEGTSIEPARGYGYRYLEEIQDARRRAEGDRFPYRPADLRLPLRIHGLRERHADRKAVDEAAKLLSDGDGTGAARRLDAPGVIAPQGP